MKSAQCVLYGTVANPRMIHLEGEPAEVDITDFHVSRVLKADRALGGMKLLHLKRFVPIADPKNPPKFVIFVDVEKDQLDAYYGLPVDSPDVLTYLESLARLTGASQADVLRYCFRHVEHKNRDIVSDAFRELGKGKPQDLRRALRSCSLAPLRRLLQRRDTPPAHRDVCAYLLGLCGTQDDARLLRFLFEGTSRDSSTSVRRLLVGYVLLEHRARRGNQGLAYVTEVLRDRSRPFAVRYSAYQAVRFCWDQGPDAFDRKRLLEAVGVVLDDPLMTDFAVEDLCRWGCWHMTDRVLQLYGKAGYESPIIRRKILRYALCSPSPRAAALVKRERARNPDLIADQEELLQLERQP
jgi:hypothetical protein